MIVGARLPLAVALGAAGGLLVVLVLAPTSRSAAAGAYVLALGLVALSFIVRPLLRAATRGQSEFEQALRRPAAAPQSLRELTRIENDVIHGTETYGDFRRRLQPLLWDIAADRLATRHGVDPLRDPERARALLGTAVWDVFRPDLDPNDVAVGLPRARLRAVVERLEAL